MSLIEDIGVFIYTASNNMLGAGGSGMSGTGSQRLQSFQFPVVGGDDRNDLGSVSAVPPAPGTALMAHPLLSRSNEISQAGGLASSSSGANRLQRSARQRSAYRYNTTTQTLHIQYARSRHANTSAILQRYCTTEL